MDSQKTGQLIAQRRKELGWTQKDLGEQLHVSDRTVSKWERAAGFPDISLLEPLADALGLSVLELLNGERMKQEDGAGRPECGEAAGRAAAAGNCPIPCGGAGPFCAAHSCGGRLSVVGARRVTSEPL